MLSCRCNAKASMCVTQRLGRNTRPMLSTVYLHNHYACDPIQDSSRSFSTLHLLSSNGLHCVPRMISAKRRNNLSVSCSVTFSSALSAAASTTTASTTKAFSESSSSAQDSSDSRQATYSVPELRVKTFELIRSIRANNFSMDVCYDIMRDWLEHSRQESRRRREGVIEYPRISLSILRELEKQYDQGGLDLKPAYYEVVLRAFVECRGHEQAANETYDIVKTMIARCLMHAKQSSTDETTVKPVGPTTKCFNIAFDAWAKSKSRYAGKRAEQLFAVMQKWNSDADKTDSSLGYDACYPNEATYATIINAWAQSGRPEAPENAVRLLKAAIEERKTHVQQGTANDDNKVSVQAFHATMNAWSRSVNFHGVDKVQSALEYFIEQMHNLDASNELEQRLEPTAATYSILISFWSGVEKVHENGRGAANAESVLLNILDLHRQGRSINLPTIRCFTSCISAWAACVVFIPDAPTRAQKLFDEFLSIYEATNHKALQPDSAIGNALLLAWSRTKREEYNDSYLSTCQEVLRSLQKHNVRPDVRSYGIILEGMARRCMAAEAVQLIEELEDGWKQDSSAVRPNLILYTSVLNAIKNYATVNKNNTTMFAEAEKLYDFMIEQGSTDRPEIVPDLWAVCIVLKTLAASNEYDTLDRVNKLSLIIEKMKRVHDIEDYRGESRLCEAVIEVCIASLVGETTEESRAQACNYAFRFLRELYYKEALDRRGKGSVKKAGAKLIRLLTAEEKSRHFLDLQIFDQMFKF